MKAAGRSALILVLLLLCSTAVPKAQGQSAVDSLRADVARATREFLYEWRSAWGATQRRPGAAGDHDRLRDAAAHCHFDYGPARGDGGALHRFLITPFIIRNTSPAHASCPTWYPNGAPRVHDERLFLDGALERSYRFGMHHRRVQLRQFLDHAAEQLPADMELTRQRVRFALDGGAQRDAWQIAESCAHHIIQCTLLRGLVLYRGGHVAAADSAFLDALQRMSEPERCEWTDLGMLLEPEERSRYGALPCAERAAYETRLWWLADPLWLEPGNERRAEQFARRVMIQLLSAEPHDGRQYFDPRKGGGAVIETLLRYGWPAHVYWAGPRTDIGHDGWLEVRNLEKAPPYVVREYTWGRLHTLPPPHVLAEPFAIAPGPWPINGRDDDWKWWPAEHYARDRSRIVELAAGQSGMLRRAAATRFVWAGDVDAGLLARAPADSITAVLFESRAVADVRRVRAFNGRVGAALIVDAPLQPGQALLGVEIAGDTAHPAARIRFGAHIVQPLSALPRGAHALSQPLLIAASEDATATLDADDAVARMHATTEFDRPREIGVYWEGYGFTASDTVEVEIQVAREDRPGLLARAIAAVGLSNVERTPLGLRWRDEPGSGGAIQRLEGNTPLQMRHVVLDMSQLARGSYRLTISMKTPTGPAVSSERTFTIR